MSRHDPGGEDCKPKRVRDRHPGHARQAHTAGAEAAHRLRPMLRYLEAFYRYRLLIAAPLVIALMAGAGIVMIQPRTYEASTKIWVDATFLGQRTTDNAYITPAEAQSAVLLELLKTRSFAIKAGARFDLAGELIDEDIHAAPDLRARAAALLKGHLQPPPPSEPTQRLLDDQSYTLISQHTKVVVSGPNVITVSFDHHDRGLAARAAQAITDQFLIEVLSGQQAQAKAATTFYGGQLKGAQATLAATDGKIYDYLSSHADQRAPNAVPDVALTALRRDDDDARQRYYALLTKMDDAQLQAAIAAQATPNGYRIIDNAQVPSSPLSAVKIYLASVGATLVAGLLLSLLALLALAAGDTSLRRPEEVEKWLGLQLAGVVPELKKAA